MAWGLAGPAGFFPALGPAAPASTAAMGPMASLQVVASAQPGAAAGSAAAPSAVVVIPVRGPVELGLAHVVRRGLEQARRQGAAALLEISTFGGRVDAATDMRAAMDQAIAAGVPVAAWVPDQALSAGALIAIAAQKLYLAPGATLGAAEPRPADEKTISGVRALFEAVARSRGRDPQVAAAMVDKNVAIPGLVERGQILTLTADKAQDIGFIEGVAASRDEALAAAGWGGAQVREVVPTPAERVARFVTDPVVAPLLLSLGLAGIVAEFYVAGFGFPGIIGLVCLALYFGGHLLAGAAGWEVTLLFLLGLVLLVIELVVPGFGVFGLGGVVALGAAIVLVTGDVVRGLQSLVIALLITLATVAVLTRYAGRRGLWRRLTLPARLGQEQGFRASATHPDWLGQRGIALTPLRPAGSAQIAGQRLDVVTEGEFLPPGTLVEVVKVEGPRVVVRQVTPDPPPQDP